jgi:H+/Cl- antiporter ClcA
VGQSSAYINVCCVPFVSIVSPYTTLIFCDIFLSLYIVYIFYLTYSMENFSDNKLILSYYYLILLYYACCLVLLFILPVLGQMIYTVSLRLWKKGTGVGNGLG